MLFDMFGSLGWDFFEPLAVAQHGHDGVEAIEGRGERDRCKGGYTPDQRRATRATARHTSGPVPTGRPCLRPAMAFNSCVNCLKMLENDRSAERFSI